MRISARSAAWFALRFAGVFSVLLLSWSWLEEPYSRAACAIANWLAPEFAHTQLSFVVPPAGAEREAGASAMLVLVLRGTGQRLGFPLHLRTLAFVPTVTLIALAAATPIWRNRRGPRAFAWAWIVLQFYLVCAIGLGLRVLLGHEPALPDLNLTGFADSVSSLFFRAVAASPSMSYAIPGLIWLSAVLLTPEPPQPAAVEPTKAGKARPRSRRKLKVRAS